MAVHVDKQRCQGHALCVMTAPDIFDIGDDGKSTVIKQPQDEAERRLVRDAVMNCPERAITYAE